MRSPFLILSAEVCHAGSGASVVASGAARELTGWRDVIGFHQLLSQCDGVAWWLPVHAEDVLTGPDEALWMAVAVQAPLHEQRLFLPHQRHRVNPPMARHTSDPLLHMDTMVEVAKTGEVVHPRPRDRSAGPPALADGLQCRTTGPDLRMAVHAGLCGGDAGE